MSDTVVPAYRDDTWFPAGSSRADRARVDLRRVLTGLRHLPGGTEPARVFTALAAMCTPALCDEVVIDMAEQGGHRYRIRQPGPTLGRTANPDPAPVPGPVLADAAWSGDRCAVTVREHSVLARFGSPPGGGPEYAGRLTARWHGYIPTDTDAVLVGVLVDHAAALVHRERITTRLADLEAARPVGITLEGPQRIAAATGILMALYHLTPGQARELLHRAADRGHRSLRETADTVLHTGALPGTDHPAAAAAAARETPDHPDPDHPDVQPAP